MSARGLCLRWCHSVQSAQSEMLAPLGRASQPSGERGEHKGAGRQAQGHTAQLTGTIGALR